MKKISDKQAKKNRTIALIKQQLINEYGNTCRICGNRTTIQLAHLLPKGRYPEYYLEPQNHALLCQECHQLFDDDRDFRSNQIWAYEQVKLFAPIEANKYYSKT